MSDNRLNRNEIILLSGFALCIVTLLCFVPFCVTPQDPICDCQEIEQSIEVDESEGVEVAANRRTYKIYIAPGGLGGVSQADFQRRVMAGLRELSPITRADFVQVSKPGGSFVQFYPASDAMMWKWYPEHKAKNVVPLGAHWGNRIYMTTRPRWSAARMVEAVSIHEFGHRLGLKHDPDVTSIMNAGQTSVRLNANDRKKFQGKLGT